MTETTLLVCRDARSEQWQLGPLPPEKGGLTLIGWRQTPTPREAGIPAVVAEITARALSACARVTFPCSTVAVTYPRWTITGDDVARALPHEGGAAELHARSAGLPRDVVLLSTLRPESILLLFDDAAFPWWRGGQVAMLSPPESAPPDIDLATLLELAGPEWAQAGAEAGLAGILRPGVDGDVAGLLCFNETLARCFLSSLATESLETGITLATLPEAGFIAR